VGLRVAVGCLFAGLVVGVAHAAPPRWQVIPGASPHNEAVVWASGRLWFLSSNANGVYRLRSGRVAGSRLSDWKSATPRLGRGTWTYLRAPGDALVFMSSVSGAGGSLVSVRLMPNGTLADPVDVGGAPVARSSTGASFAQLPDRAVRITGVHSLRNEFATHIAVCCDVDGRISNFQRFEGTSNALGRLGVDRTGRLWLAWAPGRFGVRQQVRVVELDPQTLKARGEPKVVPGFRGFLRLRAMVCTDVCRVFVEGRAGRAMKVASWAPGEARSTALAVPGLIDVRPTRSGVAIAYSAVAGQSGYTIGTARADSRGRGLRRSGSIQQPSTIGGSVLSSIPFGAMGPGRFAAIAVYSGARATVRVAFLPLP
jgi:hypothetical protein